MGCWTLKTISKITAGQDDPARRGPTAKAQQHAGEPITSQALHDITDGKEKLAGEGVKGRPTSTARSELAKDRGRGLKDD